MAKLGLRSGGIDAIEAKAIEGVLSLGGTMTRDLMTPRTVVFSLNTEATVREVQQNPDMLSYSRIPVYDTQPDDIVGIVHRRDILAAVARGEDKTLLQDLMQTVDFVADDLPANRLFDTFLKNRRHLVVVLDEFGALAGIVTLEDALEALLGREIVDEFDAVSDMRELARQKRGELIAARTAATANVLPGTTS